jgi:hypothetical protein
LDLRLIGSVTLWCSSASPVFHSEILPAGCLRAIVSLCDGRRPYFSPPVSSPCCCSRVYSCARFTSLLGVHGDHFGSKIFFACARSSPRRIFVPTQIGRPRSAFLFPRSSVFGVECLFVFVTVFFSHRPALSPAAGQCVCSAGQSSTSLSFLPASFFLARVCFSSGIYCLALSSSGLLQLWCLDVPVCTRLLLTVELFSVELGFRFSAMCGMVAGEAQFSF